MPKDKRSFFERLTGAVKIDHDEDEAFEYEEETHPQMQINNYPTPREREPREINHRELQQSQSEWIEEASEEGQLTVDVYQTSSDIVIKTIVAGVRPDDLDVSISRDMVTIKGKRDETREASEDDYFHKELYWGAFSRTIMLPEEIDVESAEAQEKHGLLVIKLPKLDKRRQTKLKVKVG